MTVQPGNCNPAIERPVEEVNRFSERTWALVVLAMLMLIALVAVSRESFWIDELTTAHFASQPSIRAMWQDMLRLRWPELQAPLFMAYSWTWQHLFGNSEWTARLAGVPWLVIGATFFVLSFPTSLERVWALLTAALNPFTWFYLNEARLYSVQLGLTYLVVGALIRLHRDEAQGKPIDVRWLAIFCAGVCLLSMLTVLGMIWVSAAFLVLPGLFSIRKLWVWARQHWILIAISLLALVPSAGYYLWTRLLGTRAANLGGSDWRNLGFILYELLGFNGVGPGRFALREKGLSALRPWLPLIAAYGIAISLVLIAAVHQLMKSRKTRPFVATGFALAVPAGFLVMIGFLMNFRLLGRHCTPAVAVIVLLFTIGSTALWKRQKWWSSAGLIIFLLLSFVSCLSQRFAYRHAKDDYRTAASLAKASLEKGQSVWWNADAFGCEYYQVPASDGVPTSGRALILRSPAAESLQGLRAPDLVVVSKPDIYDGRGGVQGFLKKAGYVTEETLPAFAVFRPAIPRSHE